MFSEWFFQLVVGGALVTVLVSVVLIAVLFFKDIKGKQLW